MDVITEQQYIEAARAFGCASCLTQRPQMLALDWRRCGRCKANYCPVCMSEGVELGLIGSRDDWRCPYCWTDNVVADGIDLTYSA